MTTEAPAAYLFTQGITLLSANGSCGGGDLGGRGATMRFRAFTDAERETRFWERVEKSETCWTWKGAKGSGDYGRSWWGDRQIYAHRIAYELLVGRIPFGLFLDHLCRNRLCVNPRHLEVVTQRENNLRGNAFSGRNARKIACLRGHPLSGENLLSANRGASRRCKICLRKKQDEYSERRRKRKREQPELTPAEVGP